MGAKITEYTCCTHMLNSRMRVASVAHKSAFSLRIDLFKMNLRKINLANYIFIDLCSVIV